MIGTNFNVVEMGKWQTLYWNEGPKTAANHCDQIVSKLATILNNTIYPLWQSQKNTAHFQDCETLKNGYELKVEHYQADVCLGKRLWSTGRNEPGRTPLNYPDFRRRYDNIESLKEHFDKKIKLHQAMLTAIENLLQNLPAEIPERQSLELLKEDQIHALKKWQGRKECEAQFPSWILPPEKNPLNTTSIDWAHQNGYYGENGEIIVLEPGGADVFHPFLADNFLNFSAMISPGDHGTHVTGIIAAKKNESNGHTGAAPCAKIQLAWGSFPEICKMIQESPIPLVNFSGDFPNFFSDLIANFDDSLAFVSTLSRLMCSVQIEQMEVIMSLFQLKQQGKINEARDTLQQLYQKTAAFSYQSLSSALEKKLLITAIGNDGVMITESPRYQSASSSLSKLAKDLGIYVVNMHSDGLTHSKWSNLPGPEYADCTICAVGHEVFSCLPRGDYGKQTGTSMAAPFVSSVAVLLKSAFPQLNNDQIRKCILDSAIPIVLDEKATPHLIENTADFNQYTQEQINFSKQFFGKGLLNAKGAFELAKSLAV